MAIAETIECLCNECNILICISSNAWIEVSATYSTYERPGAFTDPGLEQVEQIREGSRNSELEGCLVKPLRCYSCKTPLGVRCVEAPVEKRANVNRSYLKLTKMTLKSITSGNLVEVRIKQRQDDVLEISPTDPLTRRPNLLRPPSSKEYSAPQRRGSEVEDTEAPSSDQVFDLTIGPTADPISVLEEQRKDIGRIMASVNILRQDMKSLRESVEQLEDRKDQASHDFVGGIDILTDHVTEVSSRLGELDALKLEMKMMQQRIKRMEESRSTGRRPLTVLDTAQVSRRPSPTIDEQAIPRNDAPSNGSPFSATQIPMSANIDSSFAPRKTASERPDVVDAGDTSYQGLPLGSKDESLPPQTPFTTRPKTSVNGTASKGSHTPVNMSHPQIPRKGPEQKNLKRSSSAASNVATPRTTSISVTGTTNPTSLPRLISQMQEASNSSHHGHQESHIYDDELVNDIRPLSFTRSSTENSRQPAKNTAQLPQNRDNERTQQPPLKSQRRQSVPKRLPTVEREKPNPSNTAELNNQDQQTRGRTTHHDSKRRKTTAFSMDHPSTSIWATDFRGSGSSSGRRDEQSLVKVNVKADGRSASFQNHESKKRNRPGERDEDGYLLKPDGTRDPRSVKSFDSRKKKKAEMEVSG